MPSVTVWRNRIRKSNICKITLQSDPKCFHKEKSVVTSSNLFFSKPKFRKLLQSQLPNKLMIQLQIQSAYSVHVLSYNELGFSQPINKYQCPVQKIGIFFAKFKLFFKQRIFLSFQYVFLILVYSIGKLI